MKKFLAIFLTSIMLLSQAFIIIAGATPKTEANQEKLTDELKAEMETKKNNEYISIYIWLSDLGDDIVYSNLSNKLGKEINKNNEDLYIQEKVNNKVEKYNEKQKDKKTKKQEIDISDFRNEAEISKILTDEEIQSCLNDGKTYEQIIELSEQYQYISDFRDSREYVNISVNELFENNINRAKCRNVNIDLLLPYATMECKKSYISKLSTMGIVTEIGLIKSDDTAESQETIAEEADEEDEPPVDEYIISPVDTQYTGSGIRVGVIDRDNYNPNATHLLGKSITSYTNGASSNLSHSTVVLSILCGSYQINDGQEYQGISPEISLFFVNAGNGVYSDLRQFRWLIIDNDVAVINISMQISVVQKNYGIYDNYLDCLTQQYRVVFVKSSGNEIEVTSPGMAYNVITVGNMSNGMDSNNKCLINLESSSYDEELYLTNKPDICAFATNVCMLYNNEKTILGTGTSAAAPQVTGTIALMMQAKPSLIGNPHKVKSILLTSADDENVSETIVDNSLRCSTVSYNMNYFNLATSITRNKTGAGILNIKASIENAIRPISYLCEFTANGSKVTNEIYIPSNIELKVGLVFEKADHDLITQDNPYSTQINFEMIDINTGNVVFSSVATEANSLSNYDNVKIFDIKTKVTGTYVFRITCSGIDITDITNAQKPAPHEVVHNKINVALSITCSCLNPIRGSNTDIFGDDSTVQVNYCNSYGCLHVILTDITYYTELTRPQSFGNITYTIRYNHSYSNEIIITDANMDVYIELTDSTQTSYVRITHGNIETVSYGYLDRYYFEIYVRDNNGNLVGIYEPIVEAEFINEIDKIYLYPLTQ